MLIPAHSQMSTDITSSLFTTKTSCVGCLNNRRIFFFFYCICHSFIFTKTPLCATQYLVNLDASCPQEMKDRKRPVVRQYTQQVKEQLKTFKELTSAFLRRRNKQVDRKTTCCKTSKFLSCSNCPLPFLLRDRLHLLHLLFLLCILLLSATTQSLRPRTSSNQNAVAQSCPN